MENLSEKHLKVSAIKNGTVLDHIPAEQLFRVLDILKLRDCKNQITIGFNLDSKQYGKKGIIKIAEKFFEDDELNYIALIAPKATVNIIKDFVVVEKKQLSIPESVIGAIKCANPVCVTNHEKIQTSFITTVKDGEVLLKCHFCEKSTSNKEIQIVTNNR